MVAPLILLGSIPGTTTSLTNDWSPFITSIVGDGLPSSTSSTNNTIVHARIDSARDREWRRRFRKRQKRLKRVQERELRLLGDLLSQKRYRRFLWNGYLDVVAPSGVRYRLRPGERIFIMSGPKGNVVDRMICVVPEGPEPLPAIDRLIAQYFYLSTPSGEAEVLSIGHETCWPVYVGAA